ncbi:MAG: hypothetical protein CVV27_12355, partial [Candidatus Melainabacteria bacterium HGW-Melainabacteria-1]
MGNAPFSVSFMGLMFALVLVQIYLSGNMNWLNNYVQDRLFHLRPSTPTPHQDIVLIGITDQTISRYGWPMPRHHYITLLRQLRQSGVRAVGFNILLSTPSQQSPAIDRELVSVVGETSQLVMPFFYDYAENKSYSPLPKLSQRVATLGNVSMYPGEVARFVESELVNRSVNPPQAWFPMGVELARMYLGLPPQALLLRDGQLRVGNFTSIPLDENGLLRIHYLGPPGFFPRIALEDVLSGQSPIPLKDKLVL